MEHAINTPATWLAKHNARAKAHISAVLKKDQTDDAGLPEWARTATTKSTRPKTSVVHGAAILSHATTADKDIPRVEGWRKVCDRIISRLLRSTSPGEGRKVNSRPGELLIDIAFQHHHSTNGRWNAELGRWERWGVRPVAHWALIAGRDIIWQNDAGLTEYTREPLPVRTFHRLKDRLVSLGLITAEAHKWQGVSCLWIKPTAKLCEILFHPGAWDEGAMFGVKEQAASPNPTETKKPRGMSAKAISLKSDMLGLYKKFRAPYYSFDMAEAATTLDKEARLKIYRTLTEPYPLSKRHNLKPYIPAGSKRRRSLATGLGLAWDIKTGAPYGVK